MDILHPFEQDSEQCFAIEEDQPTVIIQFSRSERGNVRTWLLPLPPIELFLHGRSNSLGSKLKLFSEQQSQSRVPLLTTANI